MIFKQKNLLFILFIIFNAFGIKHEEHLNSAIESIELNTFYGSETITDPLLIELIKDPNMQRLTGIHQYGIDYYVKEPQEYSRYDHSIGVFVLTKRYGASRNELIASLLHDISHTVFSHSGDFLYKKDDLKNAYQDDIHEEFIQNSSIKSILEKYDISVKDILPKQNVFKILEQDIPEMCTDRLEYSLYAGVIENVITMNEVQSILENLDFTNGQWYFKSIKYAKKFATIPLHASKKRWANPENFVRNTLFSDVLKKALEIGLLTFDDIHHSIDNLVWNRLNKSENEFIKTTLKKLHNLNDHYILDANNYDICPKPKFRGINPLVKVDDKLIRLTALDEEFKKEYDRINDIIKPGFYIKFK